VEGKRQGWKIASKNLSFLGLKTFKTSKVQNLGFKNIFWFNFNGSGR